jgi:hypothetical protein
MRSVLVFIVVLMSFIIVVGPVISGEGPHVFHGVTDTDPPEDLGNFTMLLSNATENVTALLMASPGPPFYSNEPFRLAVAWRVVKDPGDNNTSARVLLGIDDLAPPANVTSVVFEYTGPPPSPVCCQKPLATTILVVNPMESDQAICATISYGNESVNLTFPLEVGPPRVLLSAGLDTLDGNWSAEELEWTELPLLLRNAGGAPAIELVIDIRDQNGIVSTQNVNIVPAHGVASVAVPMTPRSGQHNLRVHVVAGSTGPMDLGEVTIEVVNRPILRVVSVEVDGDDVVEGSRVNVTALVRNEGNASSTGQLIEFLVDGAVAGNVSVFLGPGEERDVSHLWRSKGKGLHSVSARVEGDSISAESTIVVVSEDVPYGGTIIILVAVLCAIGLKRAEGRSPRARRA